MSGARLLGTWSATAVGDNSDLQVLCQEDNVFSEILAAQPIKEGNFRMGHEDLRGLIAASELDDGVGDVGAANHLRFDLQAPGEPKMFLYSLSFPGWQLGQFRSPVYKEGGAIGAKIVGYPPASTNEHGGRRIGCDVNENAFLCLVIA
jgi:hypothetical protein